VTSCRSERGNAVVSTILAMAFTLLVVMAGTNLVVDQYGQGVLRTAVDEGALAGAASQAGGGALAACQSKESEITSGLLSGGFGRNVALGCSLSGNLVVASARGRFPGWLPPVPALSVNVVGTASLEKAPTPAAP
jgi:hypothetical protein